ncbi:MAG: AI-2E family transporter [Synechocystis sp.]|nr:AI-2E family transporter [Synechocystis sp.]
MQALINSFPGWLKALLVFPLLFLNGVLLFLVIGRFEALFNYLIIATLIAFLLKLTIRFLVNRGIRRGLAIAAVGIVSFATIVFLGLTFVPLMVTELGNLVDDLPKWLDASQTRLDQLTRSAIATELANAGVNVDELVQKLYVALSKGLNGLGGKALGLLTGTLNGVINTFVILILTIFLLLGGESFWQGIFSWFPQPWDQKVPRYTAEIFKDYFLSRLILATGSSIARLIVFLLLGLPYAILFAFGLGLASLIPFAGAVVTLFGMIILALKSGALATKFFLSAIVIDQITDNAIAPKLMGDKIGLNPVWILISIFIGAELGGLLGVLLAVPVASVIKRIVDELRSGQATNAGTENHLDPPGETVTNSP